MTSLEIILSSPAFGDSQIDVLQIEGEERLGQLFSFDVVVTTPNGHLDEEAIMRHRLTLTFRRDGKAERVIHGIAADIEDRTVTGEQGYRSYRIRLVPRLWLGTVNEALDIFMEMSIPEIIQAKLEAWQLKLGEDFVFRLRTDYPKREFVVQYRESDVAFISRWCEHLGITLSFEHDDERDIVVFSDHQEAFSPVEGDAGVPFRDAGSGTGVSALVAKRRTLPQRYILRDYNYRTPGIDLTVVEEVPSGRAGDVVEYGAHFKTPDEGKWFAGIRVQEVLSTQRVLYCTANEPRLRAGATFKLEGHAGGDVELLVTEIDHSARLAGPRGGGAERRDYTASFRAIAKELTFRPPRLTPRPKVQGVLTGVIDAGAKGDYAEIDADGRYRVKFLYDTADRQGGLASKLVRMAQPHSGGGYGMHFPLRPGVEVILTCVDGDPDRPVIASTVPNPSNPSPVTGGNNARNIIRTGGGNEINIDDTAGSHRIKMTTPHAETVFQLGAPNFNERGAALATRANWTATAQGVATTISSVATAAEKFKSIVSRDIVTGATPFKLDADWMLDTAGALLGVASGVHGIAKSHEAQEVLKATQDRDRKAHAAQQATKKYETEKLRQQLSADQRWRLDEYDAAMSERSKHEAAAKAARATLANAKLEYALSGAQDIETMRSRRRTLEQELEDDPTNAEKRREADDLDDAIARAEKADIEKRSAQADVDEADELLARSTERAEVAEKELAKVVPAEKWSHLAAASEDARAANREATAAATAAATITRDSSTSSSAEALSVLGIAKAGIDNLKAAKKTLGELKKIAQAAKSNISDLSKLLAEGHKQTAIGMTAVRYAAGLRAANRSVLKTLPKEMSTPFHVLHSVHTTGLLGTRQVVVGGDNVTVHADATAILGSGERVHVASDNETELLGINRIRVTAGGDLQRKKSELNLWARGGRVSITANETEPKLGATDDIGVRAKQTIQVTSTTGAIGIDSGTSVVVRAGEHPTPVRKIADGSIDSHAKASVTTTCKKDASTVAEVNVGLYGKKMVRLVSGRDDGMGLDVTGAEIRLGTVGSTRGADFLSSTVDPSCGISILSSQLHVRRGQSQLSLQRNGNVLLQAHRELDIKAERVTADAKKLLLG